MDVGIDEAARLMGRSSRVVRYLIKTGKLKTRREGRKFLIATADLPLTEKARLELDKKYAAARKAVDAAIRRDGSPLLADEPSLAPLPALPEDPARGVGANLAQRDQRRYALSELDVTQHLLVMFRSLHDMSSMIAEGERGRTLSHLHRGLRELSAGFYLFDASSRSVALNTARVNYLGYRVGREGQRVSQPTLHRFARKVVRLSGCARPGAQRHLKRAIASWRGLLTF